MSSNSRGGGWNRGRGFWRGHGHGNQGARGQWRGRGAWYGQRGRGQPGPSSNSNQSQRDEPPMPKRRRMKQTTLVNCPYKHWKLYLPEEDYVSNQSGVGLTVKALLNHFTKNLLEYADEDVEMIRSISVNHSTLSNDQELITSQPDLSMDIRNKPELLLNCMALAFHTALEKSFQTPDAADGNVTVMQKNETLSAMESKRFFVRLYGFESSVPLKNIKAPLYGKCVSVNGTVVRVSSIKPLVTQLAFRCVVCQEVIKVATPDGKYVQPTSCSTAECRSRTLTPLRTSHLTETIDWQRIRLQEIVSDDRGESGRIPRTIDCELTADLVDSCVPGDVVTVTAVVKATGSSEENYSRSSRDKCMFLLYLQAISVVSTKSSCNGASETDFSTKDYYAIQEIHSEKDIFRLLVGSLCPTIYGHELVKAGLLLGLFGGRLSVNGGEENLFTRGNPHVLVVGDPGLGKSQMLQAAANVAPRGVYVCGNTSTATGLTVTLAKEAGSNEYSLEAGALVLGDQGCCCIDEFDKMGTQHQALLEAMEQQSISIAKAGIVCTLPARTSILAAANPVGGHYNKGKTVSENLKMNSALLSRFDLVFILLDKPDEEMDCVLSEHVMSLHSKRSLPKGTARRDLNGSILSSSSSQSMLALDEEQPLVERLKVRSRDEFDPLPAQLLRKYIGYARTYVHSRLSPEAGKVLQEFYLKLRRDRRGSGGTPITTRQLESLIRLTEARAKLELRETATEQDAKDVVEIMKHSMCDTYSDEHGFLDFQRSQHGSGMSQKSQAKRFVSELTRISETTGNSVFNIPRMREISQRMGLKVKSFDDFIFSLNNQGYLLKKGPNMYKVQTSSYM